MLQWLTWADYPRIDRARQAVVTKAQGAAPELWLTYLDKMIGVQVVINLSGAPRMNSNLHRSTLSHHRNRLRRRHSCRKRRTWQYCRVWWFRVARHQPQSDYWLGANQSRPGKTSSSSQLRCHQERSRRWGRGSNYWSKAAAHHTKVIFFEENLVCI